MRPTNSATSTIRPTSWAAEDPGGGDHRAVVDVARAADAEVVHVAHRGTGSFFAPGRSDRFLTGIEPRDDERVVHKTLPNALAATDLQSVLGGDDGPVVIVGFMTHMCVSSTTRAAVDLELDAVVLSDACATRALPSVDGGVPVPAATVHTAALAELADRFATVCTKAELLGR